MRWNFSLYLSILCLIFVKAKSISDSYNEQQKQYEVTTVHEILLKKNENYELLDDMPPNFDWRERDAVTKVKDQKDCNNADYAFAAIGALEGKLSIQEKKLVELSAQELIDCSNTNGNYGCDGGSVKNAFAYINAKGISTEQSYPFNGQAAGTCLNTAANDKVPKNATIICGVFPDNSEVRMKQTLQSEGPILAIIDGSQESFINYKEGIYQDEKCGKNGQHNVLIVGYGETDQKEKYWIVKNSWGENWGEKGYIRIAREKDNTCGIASNATYIALSG